MLAFKETNALKLKQLNPPRLGKALRLQRDAYEGYLKLYGQEHPLTLRAANNLAVTLSELQPPSYKEAKALLRRPMLVTRRVLGENDEITFKLRTLYATALYGDHDATLEDLREAVTTLEDAWRIARRVLGGAHPLTSAIEDELRKARAALRLAAPPPPPDGETTSRCVICMASQSDHFCIPCGHVVYCGSCARDPRLEPRCPVCREHVEGVRRVEARPRGAAAPDARRAQTEARSYLPTPWSVEGQAAAERRFLERCRAAERQAAERQRQAEAAARQAEADRLRAATAWTPADEEELAALRLEATRREREAAAERQRQEAAERRRQEAAAERRRRQEAAAERRRQEAAANKAQEAAKRRAEARPPAGMTGLEMQNWQRRAIDRILDIDAEKEPDMILGVQRGAPKDEVKKAYKALAILFHPDKCSAPDAYDAMQKINTARQKLFLAATSERECAPPPPPRTPSTSSPPPPRPT